MVAWLDTRGEEPPAADPDFDHSAHLPGMLSPADLRRLEQASGRAFDLLFLRGMQRHHEGAIRMVTALRDEGGGQEPELADFMNHVVADQNIEISRIEALLAELARS